MVLARWQATIVDDAGNVQNAASVEVREETGGSPLAIIYSDRAGATPLDNPFIVGSDGFAAFHVADGAYKITATKDVFSRQWRYVPISMAAEGDISGAAVAASGQSTLRTLGQFFDDLNSLKNYGALGDGSTDDTSAVSDANGDERPKFVPDGIYDTTLAASALNGPYWGRGQIRDAADHLRGPWFSAVKAAPASFGDTTSVTTAFDGDLSKVQIAMEHRITGASTLGTPSTGYQADPEASAQFLFLFNSSGHNESLSGNDGRTACSAHRIELANTGQGDCMGLYINGVVSGTNPGSTHFLSNPAVSMFAGALFAGTDGVFLNPAETQMHDNGHDVAAVGWNMVLDRTVATGAKEAFWAGFRTQSQGSQPIDVAFSVIGPAKYGLDLVHGTYTNNAAISLKAGQRIYGNALVDSASLSRFPSSAGDDYLTFNSTANGWETFVDGAVSWRVEAAGVGRLVWTDAGSGGGPFLLLNRDSASPAASDDIGFVTFNGRDSGGNETAYGAVSCAIIDPTDTSEDGQVLVRAMVGGALTNVLRVSNGVQIGAPTGGYQGVGTLNMDNAIFRDGTQVVNTRVTGWGAWTGTASRATRNADGPPTPTQVAQAVKALIDDLISHGLIGA